MNSEQLQKYVEQASQTAGIDSRSVNLLGKSVACYLDSLAESVGAKSEPESDLLSTSISLLFLSDAANELDAGENRDALDYLVGMGFEQSGQLLARNNDLGDGFELQPLQNDYWYRLILSVLHYLAGGFRVQARSAINSLWELINTDTVEIPNKAEYEDLYYALRRLYSGKSPPNPNYWDRLLDGSNNPEGIQNQRLSLLAKRIKARQKITLEALGENNEKLWLESRGIKGEQATTFWKKFLENLENEGITSFTNEQIGPDPGLDSWLQLDNEILVNLPTGAGKTIIGELKTALMLAQDKQVVWILPTRALVRQIRSDLSKILKDTGVVVEELPTTEDFLPLFAEDLKASKYVAVTTPEKLAMLIRAKRDAISKIGLVVLDEAQNMFESSRGATFELVVQELSAYLPNCKFVLMSAMPDSVERLSSFLRRLKPNSKIIELLSQNRPTRRINGVLTTTKDNRPAIACYSPGLQIEDDKTVRPYTIIFQNLKVAAKSNELSIGKKILKPLTESHLKTVLFVERKRSTVPQARAIAKSIKSYQAILPLTDIDRLKTELGRDSVVLTYGQKGVVPHHAGLTHLEHHIIEKWIRKGLIKTVVATRTLAQGVNLPFDISILAFLKYYDVLEKGYRELSQSEILNMLGRAGRAGYVSDGVCLIALPRVRNRDLVDSLDSVRRHYFHKPESSKNFLGLSQLMIKANNSDIGNPIWLYEMGGKMNFSEAKAVVYFSVQTAMRNDNPRELLLERLRLFPSIMDLSEYFGEELDVLEILAKTLEPLLKNIREAIGDDEVLFEAVLKTGMPIEVLKIFINALREDYNLPEKTEIERIAWADSVVLHALSECQNREWYQNVMENNRIKLEELFSAVEKWRSGFPISTIEQDWRFRSSEMDNQIAIGEFLNHKLSLLAQFWGALSICEQLLFPEQKQWPLEHNQAFVREGIASLNELHWLNGIGRLDRVLAHKLAQTTPQYIDTQALPFFIQRQLQDWRNGGTIPESIAGTYLGALHSIINE